MNSIIDSYSNIPHVQPPAGSNGGGLSPAAAVLGIVFVIAICAVFMVAAVTFFFMWQRRIEIRQGKKGIRDTLTPTQRFILAASSPTVGNNYKCVIDIWGTRTDSGGAEKAVELFEWGWGECTCENARKRVGNCLERGYNVRYYQNYYSADEDEKAALAYDGFKRRILEETKKKYPRQGMLAWDLVRILSIVGGAYMGGVMEYGEAAEIALKTCRILQENFSSWDDMVGSYTLGYQLWRGRKKKDRLRYYKKLKRESWIYNISWDTVLREEEL